MYKIGIVGHTPDVIGDIDKEKRHVCDTLDILSYQYGSDLVYNISADIGVGLWAAEHCLNTDKKYHLFLPYLPEILGKHWYNEQKESLERVYGFSHAISVIKPSGGDERGLYPNTVNEHIVENSNFTVVFWNGRKQSHTFETICYSFDNDRMVIDGNTLRILTKEEVDRKKD